MYFAAVSSVSASSSMNSMLRPVNPLINPLPTPPPRNEPRSSPITSELLDADEYEDDDDEPNIPSRDPSGDVLPPDATCPLTSSFANCLIAFA